MKRFVSRLKPLLRLRQQQEKLAALQLAEAARQAEIARLELQRQQSLQQQATAAVGRLLTEGSTGGTLASGRQNSQWHRSQVLQQTAHMESADRAVAVAGQHRRAAWKDLQVAEEATQRERSEYEQLQRQQQLAEIVDRASVHNSPDVLHAASESAAGNTRNARPLCDFDSHTSGRTQESD